MHFYHNEQFILKIYSYKKFFKQGSDETFLCIAFARFVSGFQLRAYLHAVCLIFTIQTIGNISRVRIALFLFGDIAYMKAFIFTPIVYLFFMKLCSTAVIQDRPGANQNVHITFPFGRL